MMKKRLAKGAAVLLLLLVLMPVLPGCNGEEADPVQGEEPPEDRELLQDVQDGLPAQEDGTSGERVLSKQELEQLFSGIREQDWELLDCVPFPDNAEGYAGAALFRRQRRRYVKSKENSMKKFCLAAVVALLLALPCGAQAGDTGFYVAPKFVAGFQNTAEAAKPLNQCMGNGIGIFAGNGKIQKIFQRFVFRKAFQAFPPDPGLHARTMIRMDWLWLFWLFFFRHFFPAIPAGVSAVYDI